MKKIFLIGLLISVCIIGRNVYAITIYVNPGESIQDAINSADYDDDILVESGTYYENLVMKDGVDLVGLSATVVGNDLDYTIIGANASISGFHLKSSHSSPRTIYADAKTAVIDNNVFEGFLHLDNGNYTVTNNIFLPGWVAIDQIYQPAGQSIVKNNLAIEMSNGFQFETAQGGSILVENNTLIGKNDIGLGMYIGYGEINVRDNIIAGFHSGFSASSNNFGLNTYNLLNNTVNYSTYISQGTGEIFGDPLFVAGEGPYGDYYLSQTNAGQAINSPAVDAGDPSSTPYGWTSTTKFVDVDRIDMGYHYIQKDVIPEPSTMLLLGLGFLGAGFFKRK